MVPLPLQAIDSGVYSFGLTYLVLKLPRIWTNSSGYPLFFPSSNNPGKTNLGSDFYATPLSVHVQSATNVTLQYSIFFRVLADFEFYGNKLPGLYSGQC